eukprot:5770737-Prymnesium_polylepis.2
MVRSMCATSLFRSRPRRVAHGRTTRRGSPTLSVPRSSDLSDSVTADYGLQRRVCRFNRLVSNRRVDVVPTQGPGVMSQTPLPTQGGCLVYTSDAADDM